MVVVRDAVELCYRSHWGLRDADLRLSLARVKPRFSYLSYRLPSHHPRRLCHLALRRPTVNLLKQ
jgi:hypothetical protein